MSRVTSRKGGKQVSMGEAASRVVVQVYHTGQGRIEARGRVDGGGWPLSGLDSAWSVASNPHRESGTRWRAAADVGAAGTSQGTAHGRQKGRDGNRLGDSVGAYSPRDFRGPSQRRECPTGRDGQVWLRLRRRVGGAHEPASPLHTSRSDNWSCSPTCD